MFPWLRTASLWAAAAAAVVVAGYFAAPYVKPQIAALFRGDNGTPIEHGCLDLIGTIHFNPSPSANPNGNGTVTLTGSGPSGFGARRVTVRSLTAGVSVVSAAQQTFPSGTINGSWALSGLTPGQFIVLSVDAVDPGHGSKPGTDKCCSTNVYLQVPGKINLAVQKTTTMTPDGTKEGTGYQFALQATNTADPIEYGNVVTISDIVPAGLQFTSATGTNWNCGLLSQYPVAAGGTLTCVYSGPVPIATGAILPPITVSASVVGSPTDTIENCATVAPAAASGYSDTVATDNRSCINIFPQFRPHDHVPPFTPKCGMDVLFVVDESYSIYDPAGDGSNNDQSTTVRNALIAAAHAFAGDGTNANARVIYFGSSAAIGGWGAWQPLTNANANNIANGYNPSAASLGFGTNWDAALRLAYTELQTHGAPALVVFITDGRPNYFVDLTTLANVMAASGSAGEVDATNHATYAVDNIYTLNDKIIGVGIGPFMTNPAQPNPVPNGTIHLQNLLGGNAPAVTAGNPFDPATGSVVSSGNYGGLSGMLLGLAGSVCPNIQLIKYGSEVDFGPDDFDGTVLNARGISRLSTSVTLKIINISNAPMTGIQVKDVLPGPTAPYRVSNPTGLPAGTSFTTSGGRDTVIWDTASTLTLGAYNTTGFSQTLTFRVTLDPAWVTSQYNSPTATPADGILHTASVLNYAQVTHVDQTVGSAWNNMAGPDGPVHEIDESVAAIIVGTHKVCDPAVATCSWPDPGPWLHVKKTFKGDSEAGCAIGQPCKFEVTVSGTYLGPIAFGDGMFTGPHTTLTSTSTPLGLPTQAAGTGPNNGTWPYCSSATSASYSGSWFCYHASYPDGATATGSNPNVTSFYTHTFTVSFTPTAPGTYTNCYLAMMWPQPQPTSFGQLYTQAASNGGTTPAYGNGEGNNRACADAHTPGVQAMMAHPPQQPPAERKPPPCDTHAGPAPGACKPVCQDGTHWNGASCLTCKAGEDWDDRHGRCIKKQVCDPHSTRGDSCTCRYDGMVRRSQTTCGCPEGSSLIPGTGCIRRHAICDEDSTTPHGASCMCRYPDMRQPTPNRCVCPQGATLEPGRGCVLVCRDPMVLNRAGTACGCPEGTKLKEGRCEKKGSFLDDIFGGVHIGVGVGGGAGHERGDHSTPHDHGGGPTPGGP